MTSTCPTDTTEWNREQSDWLTGEVTVNVTIDTQPVAVSVDSGTTFIDAEWTGDPETTRSWQVYVSPDLIPVGLTYEVIVRVTDTTGPQPVHVYLPAGTITFT